MSSLETLQMKRAAEAALDRGFSVFATAPNAKVPRPGTHGHLDATALPAEVDRLWDENPEYNPAVSCAASNLIVLDFDEGNPPSDLPRTYTVKTARGYHVYFWGQMSGTKLYDENGKKIGELKSADGYVLAAGARHPSGAIYTVVDDSPVAEAPTEIIRRITKKLDSENQSVSLIGDKIPYGSHDIELTRIGGRLRAAGMEEESITDALIEVCLKRCEGYGSDYPAMCAKIAKSVCKYPVESGLTLTLGGKDLETGIQVSAPLQLTPVVDPNQWRSQFKVVDELEDGDVRMVIENFLPEGTIFFGGLSGKGKTWLVLSVVKSLTTGRPFVNAFSVNERIPVLYLIPESSGRAFKSRLKKFGIPSDPSRFLCRTLSEGPTLLLNDPYVVQCVKELKPIIVLDTAIRFSTAQDENAAMQNKVLADSIVALRQAGAVCVIGIHHATKASAGEKPSLETTLRGTGDFAAMCDAVYHVDQDELDGTVTMKVTNVKSRDFIPPEPFRLYAKKKENNTVISVLDSNGDFEMVDYFREIDERNTALAKAIIENPAVNTEALAERLRIDKNKISALARSLGWEKVTKRSPWTRIEAAPSREVVQ
jgi:Bifunctional DNA primase/polymerase, N-terminal/AAA domain